MRVFDLNPSLLPAGDINAWSGPGFTLTALAGVPVRGERGGFPSATFTQAASGPPAWLNGTTTVDAYPSPVTALHTAIVIDHAPTDSFSALSWGNLDLVITPGGIGTATVTAPITWGEVCVVSLIHDDAGTVCYINGEPLPGVTSGSVFGTTLIARCSDPGMSFDLLRVFGTVGTASDALADMAGMLSEFFPTGWGTAAGQWGFTGSVRLAVQDPWEPPTRPVIAPGGSVIPPPPPPPQAPPATVNVEPIRRISEVMPAPVLDTRGNPIDWAPTAVIKGVAGRLQIVVEGEDITYLMGVETPCPTWSRVEPFGSDQASISLPQITAFHRVGHGTLSWCRPGANVDILLVREDGSTKSLFAGVVTGFGHREDAGVFGVECLGVVFSGDLQLRPPPFIATPQDAGRVIAGVLNDVVGRRYDTVPETVTGISVSVLGGWESRVSGWVQGALATLVTGGSQWTVKCDVRSPIMALKDVNTIGWTVSNGQRGISVELTQDITQAPNVIYAEGIGPDGGRWRNAKYPNWNPDNTPAFPNNPIRSIEVGWTDARTTSGNGVSTWQAKAGRPVTGRFSQADSAQLKRMQDAAGVKRDGVLGPQSWAMTFETGSNTGTLDGAFIMPAAYSPSVEPHLYAPDGDIIGANPEYSPGVLRVERYINFGAGATKEDGVRAAEEILARDSTPGWVGTVTMDIDPEEGSRLEVVREGTNGLIRSFRGEDLKVHVARVEFGADTVTATVDTNARDYPTLDAILDRDREATDPARSFRKSTNTGDQSTDRATWDAESPGGRIPKLALYNRLWTVLRIPVAQYGSIVRTEFTTTGSPRPFSVAVFDRPITAAKLLNLVGNPLDVETTPDNPWQEYADDLDAAGLLMSWGWNMQPAGYYPLQYSDPSDDESAPPVTGRMVDDASWDYSSTQPPWLWVAMIAEGSCFIEGRFWHGAS